MGCYVLRQMRRPVSSEKVSAAFFKDSTVEIKSGYTFYCIAKPEDAARASAVEFAICTQLAFAAYSAETTLGLGFQQADKFKNTRMQPRSRQWYMLDYVIVCHRNRQCVHLTRCMYI